ncbi:hypothetical protein E4H12_05105 [Candidatus Thorarchaeota archaeon]|nr:MAG: hypothetical protein E4H12_05105 [Candidatus Thorarchaeota archaeon]
MESETISTKNENKEIKKEPTKEREEEYDIVSALKLTEHFTSRYPNGLTLGVRMESVPGTRGVHVDVVFVLDLRKAEFGGGGLAMRAAVLETVNRDLERVLSDVGLDDFLSEHNVITPFGRVRLPLLRGMATGSISLMHETRTVYVITENAKPSADLTWLTDTGRIVTADQFALIRQSDARSRLPDLKRSVKASKWNLLEAGLTRGWFGILSLIALAIGASSAITVVLAGSGSLLIPLIVSATSGVVGGWLLSSSHNSVSSFVETLSNEQEQLRTIGDATRISKSIAENEEKLQLIGHVNFVVSPLVAEAAAAMKSNNLEKTVNLACSVLDECVRLSPVESTTKSLLMGDSGLRRYIGLFEHLGGNVEKETLALGYVGLTGHLLRPINFGEAVAHLTELVNSLYNIGAIRPDIKEGIDDHLNYSSMTETLQAFDKAIAEEPEPTFDIPEAEDQSIESEVEHEENEIPLSTAVETDEHSDDLDELNELIRDSSKIEEAPEPTSSEIDDSDEDITIIASDIVKGQEKKKKKIVMKDVDQLSLFEDFDHIRASSEATKESDSVGV